MSFGGRWTPGTSTKGYASSAFHDAYAADVAFAWRLPLVLAFQCLPREDHLLGFHTALTIADLGNFARGAAEGESDKIGWRDFLQLGFQSGVLVGDSKHSVVLAGELSWSPGVYQREVMIMESDGTTRTKQLSGALFVGFTLAYYVPLFDLN